MKTMTVEKHMAASARDPLGEEFRNLREALVMIVDDEPLNIEVTQAYLEDAGFSRFVTTSDPARAIEVMLSERPHIVLLDLIMPGLSGFDIMKRMRAEASLKHTPTIVLTSSNDPATKLKSLEMGAMDFLAKPVDATELVLRLRNTLAAKAHQEYLIHYDTLTGLPNRQRATDHLARAIARAKSRGLQGAVLHIDVDRFKQVNEALGPRLGDCLLKEVAQRIERCVRDDMILPVADEEALQPVVARFEGDEFMVLLPTVPSVESVAGVAHRMLEVCAPAYNAEGRELFMTVSVGVAVFPDDGDDADTIVKRAGLAHSYVKDSGRNSYKFFSPDLDARALNRLSLEGMLRRALERDELVLFYQPKVDIKGGHVTGAEALLRWRHPERGLLAPSEFIALADETGLIVPIDHWVLRTACEQSRAWQAGGMRPITVSVNVSLRQFRQPRFVRMVREVLDATGQGRHLRLEVSETAMTDHASRVLATLGQLRAMGLQLSIDDFGTGYSAFRYLKESLVDEIKIDRSLVSGLADGNPDDEAIVTAIVVMAHALGLSVVAEGVEQQKELAFLNKVNCDECQGYLFSKPMPAEEFAASWMERRPKLAQRGR
jgi:diguanylate cyclase (GGDEF)-like protein